MFIKTDLTDKQKESLQDIFRSVGDWTQPHVVAQRLELGRQEAIALLDSLTNQHPDRFNRKYLVYHNCSDTPVSAISDNAFIRQGWICPQCAEEVDLNEINLDFVYTAIAPVDFLNPDDDLVRYWRVDYFPYYVKGFSPNTEPAFALLQGDAEMFDEVLARQSKSRQEAFAAIEEEYRRSIEAIARELPR